MKLLWIWLAIGIWNSLVSLRECLHSSYCSLGVFLWYYMAVWRWYHGYRWWALWTVGIGQHLLHCSHHQSQCQDCHYHKVMIPIISCWTHHWCSYWTWVNWVIIIATVAVWFIFSLVYSNTCSLNLRYRCIFTMIANILLNSECYVIYNIYRAPTFWLCIILLTTVCVVPEIVYE